MRRTNRTVAALIVLTSGLGWAGGFPAETLVAFDSEDGEYIVVHDGSVADVCDGRDVDSFTTGAVARKDGTLLVSYWRETHSSHPFFGGIDVVGAECGPSEERIEFEGRAFHGISLGPNEEVWVSDSEQSELLQIDLQSRSIVRELDSVHTLEDIDAAGRFFVRGAEAIQVLSSMGQPLFEIAVENSPVRVDGRGRLWTLADGLFQFSRSGKLLRSISIGPARGAFTLTRQKTLWFGSFLEGDAAVTEIGFDGTILQTVQLVDDSGRAASFDFVQEIAFVPAAERGPSGSSSDGCHVRATSREPATSFLLPALVIPWLLRRRRPLRAASTR